MSNGDNVYSCFYDLASAFDTVEFCVLLETSFTLESRENAGGYSVPGITT